MNYQSQFCQSESIQFDDSINGFQDSLQLQQCFEKFQDESINSPLQPIQKFNGLIFESENLNLQQNGDKEKTYYCEVENCQKPFHAYCLLKDHMRMHQNSIPYQKTFTTQQVINFNKEKPFQCNFCQQSFSQNSNLKRHLRIHTNEKPFVCSRCDKAFNTTSNLKQHQQIHLNERERKQFKCDVQGCNKFYFYASNLKKHKQAHQMQKLKSQSKQLNSFHTLCKVEPAELELAQSQNGIYNYNNPIIVLNNGQLFLLINSLLYNLNGEDILGHELQNSDLNPYNEHECNPLQEITHWSSFDEVKQLYTRIENDLKQNEINLTYQMLMNKNNCNSLWCSCHTMTEHNNWQNCANNPLKYQFSSVRQSSQQLSSNSESPEQSIDMIQTNGLCFCKETENYKHQHNNNCGHPVIRHAGHLDYLVGNSLHYPHGGHCDSHGSIQLCDLSKLTEQELEAVKTLEQKISNMDSIVKQ